LVKVLGPSTPEEMQTALVRMRVPAPETVYETILQKWMAKLERPLTDAEGAMLRQEVQFNDALLPRVFQDAPPKPAIDAYADHVLDQYPIAYQNRLLERMPMNSALPLRPRPPGAYLYDGLLAPKDMHVSDSMVLFAYDDGRRIITRNGQLETVVSDIDVSDLMVRDQSMTDDVFMESLVGPTPETARQAAVQHGTLINGLFDKEVIHKLIQYDPVTGTYANGDRIVRFFNGEKQIVLIKTKEFTGYVDDMPLMEYLRLYNPEKIELIRAALPPEIWEKIKP
jgi:hypothetical protein